MQKICRRPAAGLQQDYGRAFHKANVITERVTEDLPETCCKAFCKSFLYNMIYHISQGGPSEGTAKKYLNNKVHPGIFGNQYELEYSEVYLTLVPDIIRQRYLTLSGRVLDIIR